MSTVLQPAGAGNRRRIWRNAGTILGAGIVGFITFVAIFAPWLAHSSAKARPMPRPAPVIATTLPSSRPISAIFLKAATQVG